MPECDLDHTDGANLKGHEDTAGSDPWPVVFEDEPKSGYRVTCECIGCGETIQVLYRQEEILDGGGEAIWERGG